MGEAVIISVLCILSIFGIHKIFEMILSLKKTINERKLLLVYSMSGHEKNIEMAVRALSEMNERRIFVLCEKNNSEVYKTSVKIASQYKNIFVGTIEDLQNYMQT